MCPALGGTNHMPSVRQIGRGNRAPGVLCIPPFLVRSIAWRGDVQTCGRISQGGTELGSGRLACSAGDSPREAFTRRRDHEYLDRHDTKITGAGQARLRCSLSRCVLGLPPTWSRPHESPTASAGALQTSDSARQREGPVLSCRHLRSGTAAAARSADRWVSEWCLELPPVRRSRARPGV